MTVPIIRAARRSDTSAIRQLVAGLHGLREHRAPRVWRHGTPDEVLRGLLRNPAVRLLVAEKGGILQGYIAGKFELRRLGRPRRVGYIMEAFVRPDLRRRGVGVALVARLLEWFENRGAEDVTVSFVVGNRAAESFWSRLGFRPLIIKANAEPVTIRRRLARIKRGTSSRR